LAVGSEEAAGSFLAKNFQAVFRVPRPVLCDWQDFALQQLKTALPRHDETELQEVLRIMQLPKFNLNLENLARPREIKFFVNRLGALHRQWGDDVPLQMQALYLMLDDATPDVEVQLRLSTDSAPLGSVPPGLIGADWREWVAALYYNIPKERALHVLLSDEIFNALQSGDFNYFESHGTLPGLLRVLDDVINYRVDGWLHGNSATLAFAARSIKALDASEPRVEQCRNALCNALERAEGWSILNAEVAAGVLAMMEWRKSEDFAAAVVSVIAKASPAPSIVGSPDRDRLYQAWAEALFSVANRIKSTHPALAPTLRISSTDVNSYLEIVRALVKSGYDTTIPQILNPTEPEKVLNTLKESASKGNFRKAEGQIVELLFKEYPSQALEFGGLAGTLTVLLNKNNNIPLDVRRSALLALLLMSSQADAARQVLRVAVQDGNISNILSAFLNAKNNSEQEGVAASFLSMLLYNFAASVPFATTAYPGADVFGTKLREATDRDLVSRICNLAVSLGLVEQLRQIRPNKPEYEKFYVLLRQELNAVNPAHTTAI
jgi:hypothetical protein